MSRTLNLTCRQCEQTLWVGQFRNGSDECWLYGAPDSERLKLARFIGMHMGHDVRFEDSENVPHGFRHMEDEWDPPDDGAFHVEPE